MSLLQYGTYGVHRYIQYIRVQLTNCAASPNTVRAADMRYVTVYPRVVVRSVTMIEYLHGANARGTDMGLYIPELL